METAILLTGLFLCLVTLWLLGRHDWVRLTRARRRVTASVTGHRVTRDDATSYSAIYAFTDESGRHEVTDAVYEATPRPPIGAVCELVYPAGRPDLARPPRLVLWLCVYAVCSGCAVAIVARMAGYIG
ncbi:hypothetical protein KRR38_22965 [Novosphingobium sp. G106]|uniref:DUF3592 domain-containing protein n=1 Tax=Novosphingobium sp. G106 TaxID=2849500 RepID=UPI001C2DABAB|nr:DUF3592 domain-containing protein [Novosphingobium sp. G106]MBV1690464.1 hypothetical protein [Novosphingobium sp. G106]